MKIETTTGVILDSMSAIVAAGEEMSLSPTNRMALAALLYEMRAIVEQYKAVENSILGKRGVKAGQQVAFELGEKINAEISEARGVVQILHKAKKFKAVDFSEVSLSALHMSSLMSLGVLEVPEFDE